MVRELLVAAALASALALGASAEPALPETDLPLRLLGTVVSAQHERSVAVIESGGATDVVRTGDAVGAARVHEIRKDGVVLERAGRLERLAFGSISASAVDGREGGADSASPGAEHDQIEDSAARRSRTQAQNLRRAEIAARTRARRAATAVPASADSQDEAAELDASSTESLSNDQILVELSKQARYAPLLDEGGKLRGVALLDIHPDSTLERLGLRNGDVVVSVAGVKVDNTSRAYEALRALNPRAGGEVVVERRGVPTRIQIPAGAL